MSDTTEPLTQKEKVRRGLVLVGVFMALAIVAVLTLKQPAQIATGPSANATPPPKQGASPDAFSQAAEANPYAPEYRDPAQLPRSRDGRAPVLDPDEVLRSLASAGAAEEAAVAAANEAPDRHYPPEYGAPAPSPAAMTALIGTIELRPAASVSATSTVDAASDGAAPGTLIRATLTHSVSSDYPGAPWMAMVTADTYRPDGSVAIRMGEQIMGTIATHDGPNAVLQSRVPLVATQIVGLDGIPRPVRAAVLDAKGIAAIPGDTNRHVLAQGGGVVAAALLGASAATATSEDAYSTQSAFQAQAADGAAQQVSPAITKYLSVAPTITLAAGTPLTLLLTESVHDTHR